MLTQFKEIEMTIKTNTNITQPQELLFNEAPASWNTRYINPEGFECQFTLRAETGQELLERVNGAISHLLKTGCQPYSYRGGYPKNNNSKPSNGNGKQQTDNPAWCPIHQCEMKHWERDGRSWYSHKTSDGGWCKGK